MLSVLVRVSVLAGLAALALGGCARMDAALSQRWEDVSFKPGTSVAQALRVQKACSHVPNVRAGRIPRDLPALDVVSSVRFDITEASDANVAELEACVAKFPAAVGVDPQDDTDTGG